MLPSSLISNNTKTSHVFKQYSRIIDKLSFIHKSPKNRNTKKYT